LVNIRRSIVGLVGRVAALGDSKPPKPKNEIEEEALTRAVPIHT
jgi:hypothetical protein